MRPNTISGIFGRLILQENGCALWPGHKAENGYGMVKFYGKYKKVHRLVYEHFVGPVPDKMELHHVCETPLCANFAHLEPVTHRDNVLRGKSPVAEQARKTHCKLGHLLSDRYVATQGRRRCLECKKLSELRAKERRAGIPVSTPAPVFEPKRLW